jgi:transcriptional regulator with XRE-family HTH domain
MTDTAFLASLGKKIREIRLQKGVAQKDLAMHCNFEKASMSRIEAGKTNISILTLKKIGKALNVELVEFFTF